MTAFDADVIRRKLAIIQGTVSALERASPISLDEYRRDIWRRKGTERFLQEAIEAMVDLSAYLLVREGRPAPADSYGSFLSLVDLGVLEGELAQALAPSAGLRNRLVHEYDDIDDAIVFRSVSTALSVMPKFVAAVERWLERAFRPR